MLESAADDALRFMISMDFSFMSTPARDALALACNMRRFSRKPLPYMPAVRAGKGGQGCHGSSLPHMMQANIKIESTTYEVNVRQKSGERQRQVTTATPKINNSGDGPSGR